MVGDSSIEAEQKASNDEGPLVVAVSTRALFNLEEEHLVFETQGLAAYERLQLEKENVPLAPGPAFEVVQRLLALNAPDKSPLVEVVLLSQNSPNLSLRGFRSIAEHQLNITRGSFTSGRSLAPYVPAWDVDLFLSNDLIDVRSVVTAGAAAAKLGISPEQPIYGPSDEVRIAFDGDAVVFSAESDEVYKEKGLEAFFEHERQKASVPMDHGPLGTFLLKLSKVRKAVSRQDGTSRVRIAIVTARNAPANERVILTLRAWGTPVDEVHFVGQHDKAPILAAFGAHIFFDDQAKHVLGAQKVVSSALVPGPHDPLKPVIPASG